MLKIQFLSDLHIDSYSRRGLKNPDIPVTDADVILVAGDTSNSDFGMKWLSEQAKKQNKPILTISGNHEYFDEDVLAFDKHLATLKTIDSNNQKGLAILQCHSFDIDDYRILGCTMWTDFQYNADENTIPDALKFMRDYQSIRAGEDMFSPEISIEIHQKHRQWLQDELLLAFRANKTAIVMTHHSVSPRSIAPKYAEFPSNAAFVTDFTEWMHEEWSPKIWIHGHTHEAFDYVEGNTRVLVNPRAYPGEVSSTGVEFAWDKVIEV